MIHPSNASSLNITEGQTVKVSSAIASIDIAAEITEDIMEGSISIPHGWGHHRSGTQMAVAQANAGVSFNDLVDESIVESLTGVSVINAIPVNVAALS